MDVIFKFITLLGIGMLGVGIVSMYQGHDVLASVHQPPSRFAGVGNLVIGITMVAAGTIASRIINKR